MASDVTLSGVATPTWTAADQIDGGAGTNTFQVTSGAGAIANPAGATVKNMQVMKVVAADVDVDLDTTGFGLETLTVNTSGDGTGTFAATAAATTDITWTAVEQADTKVEIEGGNNVTVTATKVAGVTAPATDGGVSVTDAAGDVVVSSTGVAYTTALTAPTLGAIDVDGGKTISVTQKATSDASKAAKDTGAVAITQGDVTITAGDETTSVTVKQDATVSSANFVAAVAPVNGQATVTFKSLDAGASVTVAGLTFTAGAESLSAAEVAAAFANLSADAIIPNDLTNNADGDTQASVGHRKGVFSGSIDGYTTEAANGDKVVFTENAAATSPAATVATTLASTFTVLPAVPANLPTAVGKTAGVTAVVGADGIMGITTGDVVIAGSESLKTVTVDGYGDGSTDAITGTTNTALATLNLANGTDFDVASAAATLALNANNVQGTVDIQSGTTTLNADIKGNATVTTLDSVSVKTLNVTGDGNVAGGTLNAVETIGTGGFTGTATFTIDGEQTAYTGGAGVDNLTVTGTSGSKIVSQSLGAGHDQLDLSGLTAGNILALTSGVVFNGGDGTDTITLSAAAAEAVSLTKTDATTFLARIQNFENVQIGTLIANQTVNLGNLGYTTATALGGTAGGTTEKLTLRDAVDGTAVTLLGDIDEIDVVVKGATATKLADDVSLEIAAGATNINAGIFTAANVGAISLIATDADPGDGTAVFHQVDLNADKASSVEVTGNAAGLTLVLNAATVDVTEIDASDFEGGLTLTLDNSGTAIATNAVTVYGGKGDNVLVASNTNADELFGGAGDDTLTAGAVSTLLQGGAGNDLYIVNTIGNTATQTAGTGTQATLTFAATGILAAISSTDTLKFTFDGAAYTLAFTAGITNASDLTTALEGAKLDSDGTTPLGAGKVTAKSVAANSITIESSAGKSLVWGTGGFTDTDGGGTPVTTTNTATTYNPVTETKTAIDFSTILGFGTGDDLLQLLTDTTGLVAIVDTFAKVQTGISQADGQLINNINAAIAATAAGDAGWFTYQGSSYVVIDNLDGGAAGVESSDVFAADSDVVIKLAGVDLTNASFNSDFGTVALV